MKKLNIATAAALVLMISGMTLPAIAVARDVLYTGTGNSTEETDTSTAPLQDQKPALQTIETATKLDLQKAKTMLLDMLNRLQTHFENTKSRAALLQKLSETTGIDVGQVIDGYIAQIQDLKTRAADSATSAELKAVAQDVHNLITNAKTDVKKNIGKRVEVHIDNFAKKTGKLKPLFDLAHRRINQLQTQGVDTQNFNKDLEDCENLMKQGNENLMEAKDKFQKFRELPREQENEDDELMRDGMKMVRDARDTFGHARQDCTKVMRELRVVRD